MVFRTSVLQHLRPLVLTPSRHAVVQPPVEIRWSGPDEMHVSLSISGGQRQDLGLQRSPFRITADHFPREGGYELSLEAPRFGGWIRARQPFKVFGDPIAAAIPTPEPTPARSGELAPNGWRDLTRALGSARALRDRAQERVRFLREENRSVRIENERLSRELEAAYTSQDTDAERFEHMQAQADQLAEENRILADAVSALRLRLGAVIPCTVWGYFGGYPIHGSSGARRQVVVSDAAGQVFRVQPQCEIFRNSDSTAASTCFCVGNSWGG